MNILYLDCPSGLAGDMLLAALLDAGADEALLRQHLSRLPLPGWSMNSHHLLKNGLQARKIDFICAGEHRHRHLPDILAMIHAAALPPAAEALACRAFELLAAAEAEAHGCPVEQVHFHEVGAADAILDICGVAVAVGLLEIERVYCAPLPLSHGFVNCEHGRIPVPAPATLNLLRGYSFYDSGLTGELITPTGAALLKALGAVQQQPSFTLTATGLGAGNRELPIANVLRALLGRQRQPAPHQAVSGGVRHDEVDVLTCNIDDANGELLGYLLPLLMEAGALDACYTPLTMKKGRPAWQLQVIAPPRLTESLAALIFAESSAIGLRIRRERRLTLPRESKKLATPEGEIGIKISGNNLSPEYEDVARAARQSGRPFKEVYGRALVLAQQMEEEK